jgi:hypothetical protein
LALSEAGPPDNRLRDRSLLRFAPAQTDPAAAQAVTNSRSLLAILLIFPAKPPHYSYRKHPRSSYHQAVLHHRSIKKFRAARRG